MKVILYWMYDCKYCEKIKAELKKISSEYARPIMIEYSKIPMSQREKYQIRLYPTIIFVSEDGKLIKKIEGYRDSNELMQEYEKVKLLETVLQS